MPPIFLVILNRNFQTLNIWKELSNGAHPPSLAYSNTFTDPRIQANVREVLQRFPMGRLRHSRPFCALQYNYWSNPLIYEHLLSNCSTEESGNHQTVTVVVYCFWFQTFPEKSIIQTLRKSPHRCRCWSAALEELEHCFSWSRWFPWGPLCGSS